MAHTLRDPQLIKHLLVSVGVLVALACLGAAWFVTGLVTFVAVEVATTMRAPGTRSDLARFRAIRG